MLPNSMGSQHRPERFPSRVGVRVRTTATLERPQVYDGQHVAFDGTFSQCLLDGLSFLIRTSFLISAWFDFSLQKMLFQKPDEFLLSDQLTILESYA